MCLEKMFFFYFFGEEDAGNFKNMNWFCKEWPLVECTHFKSDIDTGHNLNVKRHQIQTIILQA